MKMIPYIALILAISGIILGASVISLSSMGDTVTKCLNSTWTFDTATKKCLNATAAVGTADGTAGYNMTDEYYSILMASESEVDVAEQMPTVAIIAIMVIIISVVAGVFVYLRYFG